MSRWSKKVFVFQVMDKDITWDGLNRRTSSDWNSSGLQDSQYQAYMVTPGLVLTFDLLIW